jgi:hypothetical protein
LIGYDKILQGKEIYSKYENDIITYFKEYFISMFSINDFENLKLITKSLLFSLIPLHDNYKTDKYYNLIFSSYLE